MDEPWTWDDVVEAVRDGQGVTSIYAQSLREAVGAGRLTVRINGEISDALRSRGLGHVPAKVEELPTGQDQLVRVYDATSVLGKMIAAALKPGLANDQQLREAVDGEAKGILEQIRSLVEL